MTSYKAAVIQAASLPTNAMGAAEKAARLIRESAAGRAKLAVFPEAFIGGYPKGASFGAPVGLRKPEGREHYRRYHEGAIALDGPEVALLAEATAATGIFVVIGVIERDGGTLYCTALFLDGAHGLVGKHRKLMPTGAERLIWGFGDGSTMPAVRHATGAGDRCGNLLGELHAGAQADDVRQGHQHLLRARPAGRPRQQGADVMRHTALEGRCFVMSACQHITRAAYPDDYDCALGNDPETVLMRGGSCIIGPLGEVPAGLGLHRRDDSLCRDRSRGGNPWQI